MKTAAAKQELSVRQQQERLAQWMKDGRNADRQVC